MGGYSKYSVELKCQVIKEVERVGNTAAVAKKYSVPKTTVLYWVRKMKKLNIYNKNNDFVSLNNEIENLKKIIIEKDLEIHILNELLKDKLI